MESRHSSPGDALADLLIEERLAVLLVVNEGDDPLVTPFLQHPKHMAGTDGILCGCVSPVRASDRTKSASSDKPLDALRLEGRPHPRVFGSAGRVLGPLVRDVKLFSLEDAVHKLSGYAASRFGLKQRGELKPGNFADLVLFDPDTISDQATYLEPLQPTIGMQAVLVNGTPIIEAGQPVPPERLPSTLPGRHLRLRAVTWPTQLASATVHHAPPVGGGSEYGPFDFGPFVLTTVSTSLASTITRRESS